MRITCVRRRPLLSPLIVNPVRLLTVKFPRICISVESVLARSKTCPSDNSISPVAPAEPDPSVAANLSVPDIAEGNV